MAGFGFQWHLTDRCNLRCRHCYQNDFGAHTERSLDDLRRLADRVVGGLAPMPVAVNLTGGEPLLVPHLPALLDHLQRFSNLEEMHLITNGTVAGTPLLERLATVPRLLSLKVSVESADDAVHDAVRGTGNLARLRANLPRLMDCTGKPVVLMTTLGRHNLATIEATVAFARQEGASGVIFERFVPLGSGRGFAGQTLDAAGWYQALGAIAGLAGLDADPLGLCPYHALWLSFGPGGDTSLTGARCNLGDEAMALMPDGTVYPCRRLPIEVACAFDQPMETIRCTLRAWRPESLRPHLRGGVCGVCGIDDCTGCRALARAAGGDLLGDDPLCPLARGLRADT